ncbi:uncharacterized protein LOC130755756 isoform X2 [Actinidia eriantha]|uniref:uncharacterized protein LOC130755756 isoform X2 n=1 Tax=Actinidia eriantha TaxID=165200 RepID=UPI002586D4D5|nr:uncharacterized protein LOC130755756 isoform X2 [Actinidia eriantha]
MARNEEEENSQRGNNNAGSATDAVRVRARPDPFLVVCWCFSLITSVAAILCIAVNVIAAVLSFKDGSDVFDGIFRCYAVVIAMFIVIAETEWGFVMKFCKQHNPTQFKKDNVDDRFIGQRVTKRRHQTQRKRVIECRRSPSGIKETSKKTSWTYKKSQCLSLFLSEWCRVSR